MCLLLSSQLRSSAVSVVFDFNASLNAAVPFSPVLLSVYDGIQFYGTTTEIGFLMTRQAKLSSRQGTMFITSATRSIVHSPLKSPVKTTQM